MAFEKNVFINCPFDAQYVAILRPIVFVVLYLKLEPRIASASLDSGRPRFTKLIELIAESKYAIHDLSRLKATKKNEFFRLNMPFELGLDIGCREFKDGKWASKKCLILEAEKYRYQAAISDMSNSDIAVHKNEPEEALREVRNWLVQNAKIDTLGPNAMWTEYLEFMAFNADRLTSDGYSARDIEELPMNEFISGIRKWLAQK
jgi:hypothetical protein